MTQHGYEAPPGLLVPTHFDFSIIDNARYLSSSYALRYAVYCNERNFLTPEDYPTALEMDEFDPHSIHMGGTNRDGDMVATVRLVMPSDIGLPLLDHCQLFPEYQYLVDPGRLSQRNVAEISRLAISKAYRRRQGDGYFGLASLQDGPSIDVSRPQRRQHPEIVFGIFKLIYQTSKRRGITHWFAAMEKSLLRLLHRYHIDFMPIGPELDYYGPVTPFFAEIAAMEKSVHEGSPDMLKEMMQGLEVELLPEFLRQDTQRS